MTIPEGAVGQDESVDVYLAVLRDDKDRPKLSGIFLFLQDKIYLASLPSAEMVFFLDGKGHSKSNYRISKTRMRVTSTSLSADGNVVELQAAEIHGTVFPQRTITT